MRFRREQYLELVTFGNFERPMFSELFGPLIGLEDEWLAQGASRDEIDMVGFDWDYIPYVYCGVLAGAVFDGEQKKIVRETETHIIYKDYLGRTLKLCKATATIPLPMDYPVKNMDDWLKLRPMFEFDEDNIERRIVPEIVEAAKDAQAKGSVVLANMPGGWDMCRELMGEEEVCVSYYTQPELIYDILNTISDTMVKSFERVIEEISIDQLSVHEDLAGKSGPMVGPAQMEQFIKPYYRKVWDLLSSSGTKIFGVDSDGDINPLLDIFLDSGVNLLLPMEPAAGMDMVKVRKKYGKHLAVVGGIDKFVLQGTKEDIRKELEYKMQPLMQQGGTIFGIDHRIPNGTPLENYRFYVKTGREILGIPPLSTDQKGWGRMGF